MPSSVPERELIAEAVAGSRPAVQQLLVGYYDRLSRHITRKLPAGLKAYGATEEILQETCVRAIGSIGQFEPRSERSFYAWLATIADRLLVDMLRRNAHAPKTVRSQNVANVGSQASFPEDLIGRLAVTTTTASRTAARRETEMILRIALAGLSDRSRQAIQLRYLQNRSIPEAAQAMRCSVNSFRGLLHRAKRQLRETLGNESLYSFTG